jgi:hypothetical protein
LSAVVAVGALGLAAPHAQAAPETQSATADTTYPEFDELVNLEMTGPDKLTKDQAVAAAGGVSARGDFSRQAAEQLGSSMLGGSYDAKTDRLHILVTTPEAAALATQIAADTGAKVDVVAGYPDLKVLEDLAVRVNQFIATLGPAPDDGTVFGAGVDGSTGTVRVTYQDDALRAKIEAAFNSPGLLSWNKSQEQFRLTNCVSRTSCGTPARSGIVIGQDVDGSGPIPAQQDCSLGFTATGSDASRWVLTAGHCISNDVQEIQCPPSGTNEIWGHAGQYFGPARCWGYDNGLSVDVARIRVDNPYWGPAGYIYNESAPNSPVNVSFALTSDSQIHVGDFVCLSAWHSTSGAACGTMVAPLAGYQAVSFQACAGDSGGGWYYPATMRTAAGLQHASGVGGTNCHDSGFHSLFTSIPKTNTFFDATGLAIVRVDTR